MTNLSRHLFQRAPNPRQYREKKCMAISLNDLSRSRGHGESKFAADLLLHVRWNVRVSSDCSRNFADRNVLPRQDQSSPLPAQFVVPDCELESERCWFGMHSVGPPDHYGVSVGNCLPSHDGDQVVECRQNETCRVCRLKC
jgi:hypothetical protein